MKIKRIVAAGAVATTLAGGAFAFANSLTVTNQTLASGTNSVDSGCEQIAVNWSADYNESNAYELSSISLDGGTGCTTQTYKVTVADENGATLAAYSNALVAGDATINPSGDHIDAADVANVTAVITGATATNP